jgi:DNA-3-methyladenine glycosylase
MTNKLKKDFYNRNVLIVANELLGKIFVFEDEKINHKLMAKIVEVEAYDGSIDRAAHTFNGKTKRNEIMFNEGGYLYVYFTYGIHYCANIVVGKEGEGTAVLLRAMEPISDLEIFCERRFGRKNISEKARISLLNGPAKICQAFRIDKNENGTNLLENKIYLLDNERVNDENIVKTTRIGIKKSAELPWRFYIKDSSFVSKK